MSEIRDSAAQAAVPTGRLVLGTAIFVSGVCAPAVVPLVVATDWPSSWKATISGLLLLGVPEVFMLVAVAVLGKPGFAYVKTSLLRVLKRHALPANVSRARYRVGLVLLLLPPLFAWLAPYLSLIPGWPGEGLVLAIGGDLVLLIALVVLGGDFWDKVRALFVYDARAQLGSQTK